MRGQLSNNRFNHTSWVAVVTPTERPKSVNSRCGILWWRFVLSPCFSEFSVGVRAFVIGPRQIFLFLSTCLYGRYS